MKRFVSCALALALCFTALPNGVQARETSFTIETVEQESYQAMESNLDFSEAKVALYDGIAELAVAAAYTNLHTSDAMLDVIKDSEGFYAKPYWDYSQYTIGYGSYCEPGQYPNGITREEAEVLLRKQLVSYENEVNAFFRRIGRQPTQQQFDAILDFTYNVGGNWTYNSSYMITKYLMNPTNDLDLVRALGSWCKAGGRILPTLCNRRMREALIFLRGEYYLPYGNIKSNLKVVPDNNLPGFAYCIFNPNGGVVGSSSSSSINYYPIGYAYGDVATATRSGYTFGWWQRSDGTMLSGASTVKGNITVSAKWVSGANAAIPSYPKDPYDEGKKTYFGQVPSKPTTGGSSAVKPGTSKPESSNQPVCGFKDVLSKSWYASAVQFVYDNGYMNGTEKDLFEPESTMTRGMLVTVLYRLAGKPAVSGENPFKDVKSGQYYYDPIRWAKNNNIVNGASATEFEPEDLVTRQQIAAILYRYHTNYLKKKADNISNLSQFTDRNQVSGYAMDAFGWAVNAGIINGTSSTLLEPNGDATRSQAAVMLQRYANLVK